MNVPIKATVETVPVDEVVIVGNRRNINEASVGALMESIKSIGLQTPITVRVDDAVDDYVLVAGRHRLEAYRRLGEARIPAVVMEGDAIDAEMWEIAENLHRADLKELERDEQVARWVELVDSKVAQSGPPSGGRQPKEAGVRKAARELNIPRTNVQRAVKVASLSDEAKTAAREVGLDDNRTALLKAAKEPTPERQAEALRTYAPVKTVSPAPHPLNDIETKEQWLAAGMRWWNRGAKDWREAFMDRIDTPVATIGDDDLAIPDYLRRG